MLNTIADVLGFQALAGDDNFPIEDIFFDGDSGQILFVAIDIGGWFDTTQVLVSKERLGRPDVDTKEWPVKIGKAEVEQQPRWKDEGWADWLAEFSVSPTLFVGPIGSGYDPVLQAHMSTELEKHRSEEARLVEKSKEVAQQRVHGLLRASEMIGKAAFGADGRLGQVSDALFKPANLCIQNIVIDNEKLFGERQFAVPLDRMREIDEGGAKFDLTEKALSDAPRAIEMGEVVRSKSDVLYSYHHPGV